MATINLSIPDAMREWVEIQSSTKGYGSPNDYVCDLIRRDQERMAKLDELQQLVNDGLASGISSLSPDELVRMARQGRPAAPER